MNLLLYALPFVMFQSINDGAEHDRFYELAIGKEAYRYEHPYTTCRDEWVRPFDKNTYTILESTNLIYPELIRPCDTTDFLGVIYNGKEEQGYYNFTAIMSNTTPFNINVDPSVKPYSARYQALKFGRIIGQLPPLMRTNFELLTLLDGEGKPFSGTHTQTYFNVNARINATEETILHDLGHSALTLPIRPDGKQGILDKEQWLNAVEKDGIFPSHYASEHPYHEDASEFIVLYLMVRWRPERFDPEHISFIEENFSYRIKILDTLQWGF